MISQTKIGSKGQHRSNESALRHRVRNLRAKVKLLLPIDLCCKYEKRSKLLMRIQNHKQQHQSCCMRRWNHTKQNSQEYYVPQLSSKLKINQFNKLSNEQIEQIKEDKLYYVGEEFIDEFDTFLESRKKSKMQFRNVLQFKSNKNINKNLSFQDENVLKRAQSEAFLEKTPSNNQNISINTRFEKKSIIQSLQEKRKMISDDNVSKRIFIRLRRVQKNKKHQQNLTLMQQSRQQLMQNRRMKQQNKMAQVCKRKTNCEQVGQIAKISQKLRDICLHRLSKSANLVYRH